MKNAIRLLAISALTALSACATNPANEGAADTTTTTASGSPVTGMRGLASTDNPNYVMKHVVSNSATQGKNDTTYPVFLIKGLADAHKLNKAIGQITKDWHCDADGSGLTPASQMEFDGNFNMGDVSDKYVSFQAISSYDCGGAHPDGDILNYVYNSHGSSVDMTKQFVNTEGKGAWGGYAAPVQLAVKYAPKGTFDQSTDCYPGSDVKSELQKVSSWDYSIGIKNHAIVITINPEHAEAACGFETSVTYAQAKAFLRPDSVLNAWLK